MKKQAPVRSYAEFAKLRDGLLEEMKRATTPERKEFMRRFANYCRIQMKNMRRRARYAEKKQQG